MGVAEEIFWRSNPKTIEPYVLAFEKRRFEEDKLCHRMGGYVYEAFSTALANAFSKKSHNYREKPFLAEEEERRNIERMTKEERMAKVEPIFAMLSGGTT